MRTNWFTEARYGLLIHYGLYSLLERGEWVWNREEISLDEYKALASRFTAEHFDGELICQMAADAGMRYVVLTTMHLEGFRLSRRTSWISTSETAVLRGATLWRRSLRPPASTGSRSGSTTVSTIGMTSRIPSPHWKPRPPMRFSPPERLGCAANCS